MALMTITKVRIKDTDKTDGDNNTKDDSKVAWRAGWCGMGYWVLVVWAAAEPEIIWYPFTEAPLFMALPNAAATDSVLSGVDDEIRAVATEDEYYYFC